jgi:ribosomal protein S18 acetylase RimI-like enzyme
MLSRILREFKEADLEPIVQLCVAEGWPSFVEDRERARRVLSAPGVVAVVAEYDAVVNGFAYFQTDGEIQAHLSLIAVSKAHRRQGVGRALIAYGGSRVGTARVDLVTDSGLAFYRSMAHKEFSGFRIYPDIE